MMYVSLGRIHSPRGAFAVAVTLRAANAPQHFVLSVDYVEHDGLVIIDNVTEVELPRAELQDLQSAIAAILDN